MLDRGFPSLLPPNLFVSCSNLRISAGICDNYALTAEQARLLTSCFPHFPSLRFLEFDSLSCKPDAWTFFSQLVTAFSVQSIEFTIFSSVFCISYSSDRISARSPLPQIAQSRRLSARGTFTSSSCNSSSLTSLTHLDQMGSLRTSLKFSCSPKPQAAPHLMLGLSPLCCLAFSSVTGNPQSLLYSYRRWMDYSCPCFCLPC